MQITCYTLFLDKLNVQARIGIHDFERERPQPLTISIEIDIAPDQLPLRDDIADTFDYDWLRSEIITLVATRHFDLQETLVRAIVEIVGTRQEVQRITVQTAKPSVYPDVAAVGCRLEAHRSPAAPIARQSIPRESFLE